MPFVIENNSVPDVLDTNEHFLDCLLTIYAAPSALTARRLRGRLYVDEVEIPFIKATWSINAGDAAGNLSIELARLSDRSAFTRTASIKLESERYVGGSWELAKTYCDGAILATSEYDISNSGDEPNDSFSVTVMPVLQQKLNLTPEQITVLYDPNKVTVNEDDLEIVPNIDGTEGTPTVTSNAGLHLGDVFQFIADTYGLAGYKTNINAEKWLLPRVDFPAAQPYWQSVAGIIGNHNPRLSIDADDYLVIRDGTLTDYITARQMTLANFSRVRLNKTIERFKGCIVTKQERDNGWDYSVLTNATASRYKNDTPGLYPLTETETLVRKYYKTGVAAPQFTRVERINRRVYMPFQLVSASAETISYTTLGHIASREKRVFGRQKAPQSWIDFCAGIPGPGFSSEFDGAESAYTSASDDDWAFGVVLVKTERELYRYAAHPFKPDAVYTAYKESEQKGLITRDSENQQLGEDFDQPLVQAQRAGNLSAGMGSYWGSTGYSSETQRPQPNRQAFIRTTDTDDLNADGEALLADDYEDARAGDIELSAVKATTSPIYVTEGGDATASLWRQVNAGEAPQEIWLPLCHRLNRQQDFPGGIDADLPTYDETMEIGVVIDPRVDGRANVSLGIFEVIGYTDTLSGAQDGGFKTSITARQIGSSSGPEPLSAVADTFEINLYADSATVDQEKLIRCVDGHTLTLVTGAVAGCLVQVKHEDDVSWTNIESGSYDLSAFAGSTETFLFRFDPSAATAPQALRFRVGPA